MYCATPWHTLRMLRNFSSQKTCSIKTVLVAEVLVCNCHFYVISKKQKKSKIKL